MKKLLLLVGVWLSLCGLGGSSTAVAFGSVGATYTEIVDVSERACIFIFQNTLDDSVTISFDGGTTDNLRIEAGNSITLDLCANKKSYTGSIQQKRTSGAPTSGNLIFTYIY